MKFKLDVTSKDSFYDVQERFQEILKKDIMAPVTAITVIVKGTDGWKLSCMDLFNWAHELGLAIEIENFPNRKDKCIARRVTGEDDIQKDKLLKKLGV